WAVPGTTPCVRPTASPLPRKQQRSRQGIAERETVHDGEKETTDAETFRAPYDHPWSPPADLFQRLAVGCDRAPHRGTYCRTASVCRSPSAAPGPARPGEPRPGEYVARRDPR